MRIEDFTFEVRDESLNRLGQLLPGDLVGWESVLRFNNVGSWSIQLMANVPMAELLSTPGYGIIVTHKDAGVVLSGPTISAETTYESGDPIGVITIMGVDDSVILADRLAYPQPSNADVSTQNTSHDSVSFMTASTAMNWYVERNLKPGVAPAARAVTGLTIGTDPIIGSAVSKSARFDVLGELLTEIAAVDHIGFDIKQVNGNLQFHVFQPADRRGTIRMDVANQTLAKTSYGYGAPILTHAIVAGQGEGLNRQFLDITTTASAASETLFNRRIEQFIDQRNTGDVDELTQAGLEKLADGGMTQTSVDVIPSSDLTMRYGTDWNLGDQVTVVVANQEVSATVTQVSIRVESNGVFIGATVGEPNGVDFESIVAKKQTTQQTRVNALERKEVPAIVWNDAEGTYEFVMKGGQVTQQIGAEQLAFVKNNTGSTILNGSAVYPNGSTGTNQLIALAQANSETASTRTFGVVSEDIANGGHGWVCTFGMVHDINTSALTEGQPVWLSPTVAGGLTSTKPTSPNHMVLIGFCVRQHAVNGSIFVKVQNGFELDELHDVQISAVAAGHILVRNAGNTAWQNKSLADAGITPAGIGAAPAVHTHAATDIISGVLATARGGVPVGGTTGQIILKTTNADNAIAWGDIPSVNYFTNGAFDHWQRGTSFSAGSNVGIYCADRFRFATGGGGAATVTRQTFTAGSGVVAGLEADFFLRYQQTTGGTRPTSAYEGPMIHQVIESAKVILGHQVTFSFYAKAASAITVTAGYNPENASDVPAAFGTFNVTTSWQRFSGTATIPASAQGVRIFIYLPQSATFTFDTFGWQLEDGAVATRFRRAKGTVPSELDECRRFYQSTSIYGLAGWDNDYNVCPMTVTYQTPMRVSPSIVITGGGMEGHHGISPSVGSGNENGFCAVWTGSGVRDYGARASVSFYASAEL